MVEIHFKEIIYQFILFIVLFFILKKFLFSPLIKTLSLRVEKIFGANKEAIRLNEIATKNLEKYNQIIKETRTNSLIQKEKVIRTAKGNAEEIIKKAEEKGKLELEKAKKEVLLEAISLKEDLRKEVPKYAEMILDKLLNK